MIKFHYFRWRVEFIRWQGLAVGGSRGEEVGCCHVYSDVSGEELVRWAQEHAVPCRWLRGDFARLPRFDLWGKWLGVCGEGVAHKVFVEDVCNVLD